MNGNENQYGGFGGQMSGGVDYSSGSGPEDSASNSAVDSRSAAVAGLLDLGQSAPEPVRDISTAEFREEVITASATRPVLVDFWAPWCGPCKQLAPALESAVKKAGGKVKLVKMNIDENPEIAGQMGIQSIPAVVAFVGGQPKDAFMGAKPEAEIERFISKLVGPSGPSKLEQVLEQASELLTEGATEEAAQLYGAILAQQPDNPDALAGYGMALLKAGQTEEARKIVDDIRNHQNHSGLLSLRAAIDLLDEAGNVGDVPALLERVESDPEDHDAHFDLALAFNASGHREKAAHHLLEIVAANREWREDGAKEQLLKFFEAWGPADPATVAARRQLSSILFR